MNIEKLSKKLADGLGYYVDNVDRRCTSASGNCYYSGKTVGKKTKGCFVGQFMKPEDREYADEFYMEASVNGLPKNLLPKWMTKNLEIMENFQMLHDGGEYWDLDNGDLTNLGRHFLLEIIEKFNLTKKYFNKYL